MEKPGIEAPYRSAGILREMNSQAIPLAMKIGISGTSGFIGSHFRDFVAATGDTPVAVVRGAPLPSCDTLVHSAGIAYQTASRAELMEANRDLTLRMADEARKKCVKRLVFVSSIHVLAGHEMQPLTAAMSYQPTSDYGASKAQAERDLLQVEGIEIVVLRPPLVYGPGAKGSLAALLKACASGMPLPFAAVGNRRSMVGVSNLCSALHFLCRAEVAGKIFHIQDAEYSLRRIITECRQAMGKPPRLFGFPPVALRGMLQILGKKAIAGQLLGDMLIDDLPLREAGWQPEATDDMARMAREALV